MASPERRNGNRGWPFNTQLAKTISILRNGDNKTKAVEIPHAASHKKGEKP
jgi:hypothetical protein